jgi:hypothetical protein
MHTEGDTLINLPIGDKTQTDLCPSQHSEKVPSGLGTLEVVDDPIGVDQIAHRSTDGRSSISRSAEISSSIRSVSIAFQLPATDRSASSSAGLFRRHGKAATRSTGSIIASASPFRRSNRASPVTRTSSITRGKSGPSSTSIADIARATLVHLSPQWLASFERRRTISTYGTPSGTTHRPLPFAFTDLSLASPPVDHAGKPATLPDCARHRVGKRDTLINRGRGAGDFQLRPGLNGRGRGRGRAPSG